jgi:hypothetical protein
MLKYWSYRLKHLFICTCLLLTNPLLADNFHGNVLDAVFLTLQNEQAIAASKQQILGADGQVLTGHSVFETSINASISQQKNNTLGNLQFGHQYPAVASNQTNYNLGVTQRLTYGLTINPVLSVSRYSDNYANRAAPSVGNAAINFTLPLLKGWGKAVNTAPEASGKIFTNKMQTHY